MSDYLSNLISRSFVPSVAVRPRIPSLFERMPDPLVQSSREERNPPEVESKYVPAKVAESSDRPDQHDANEAVSSPSLQENIPVGKVEVIQLFAQSGQTEEHAKIMHPKRMRMPEDPEKASRLVNPAEVGVENREVGGTTELLDHDRSSPCSLGETLSDSLLVVGRPFISGNVLQAQKPIEVTAGQPTLQARMETRKSEKSETHAGPHGAAKKDTGAFETDSVPEPERSTRSGQHEKVVGEHSLEFLVPGCPTASDDAIRGSTLKRTGEQATGGGRADATEKADEVSGHDGQPRKSYVQNTERAIIVPRIERAAYSRSETIPPSHIDAKAEEHPSIRVTIGRVEVRAVTAAPKVSPKQKPWPTLSLDEYLKQRREGLP